MHQIALFYAHFLKNSRWSPPGPPPVGGETPPTPSPRRASPAAVVGYAHHHTTGAHPDIWNAHPISMILAKTLSAREIELPC